MKKFHLSFFAISIMLLAGAGCSGNTTPTPTTDTTTREQQAYVYCANKGHVPKIRFDSETNRNRLFCTFEDGRECDALAFFNKQCDPKDLPEQPDINTSLTPPESRFHCEPIAKPVCTTDSQTYTNRCIAEAQGKEVKYEGVCSEQDEPFVLEAPPEPPSKTRSSGSSSSRTTTQTTNPPASNTTQPTTPSQNTNTAAPEWTNTLIALLQNSASSHPVTLYQCPSGSATYYYQKEDCANCFNILYNSSGESVCYPGMNDTECPTWRQSSCKEIWKK